MMSLFEIRKERRIKNKKVQFLYAAGRGGA